MTVITSISNNSWIIRPKPAPQARLRLFCFPYAGGGASVYRNWATGLPPEVEILPVQIPGREGRMREAPFTQLGPMIQALADALTPVMKLPFAFFGHSMGALIGFELARLLRMQRRPEPVYLFVSGRIAPQLPDPDPPLHHLAQPQFIERLRKLNGTPEDVLNNPDLLDLLMPLLRADFEVNETYHYVPGLPLNYPIVAYGGDQDEKVPKSDLDEWRTQTNQAFTSQIFSGDHFFLRTSQTELLQALSKDLVRLLQRTGIGTW